jgi:hypothetical protein
MTLQDQNGNTVTLGQVIGRGGEAEIYSVVNNPNLAAKIYFKPSPERYAKLRAMVARPPTDPTLSRSHVSICWPKSLLFRSNGPAGFLMPFMDRARHRELLKLYNSRDRQIEAPGFTWRNLLKSAENVSIVVDSVHNHGYVIGDLNESNFFVSEQTYVTVVDCDSMQVPGNGQLFRCTVGKPEFTPPELQGLDFCTVDRTPFHDNFGLAVLNFLLLMEGVNPHSGVWNGTVDPSLEERMRRGISPYAGSPNIRPMPTALPFSFLPRSTQALFVRAFKDGYKNPAVRPSPREWGAELGALGQSIKQCSKHQKHVYPGNLANCIWCERIALFGGFDSFPFTPVQHSGQKPPPTQQPLPTQSFKPTPPKQAAPWQPSAPLSPPRRPATSSRRNGAGWRRLASKAAGVMVAAVLATVIGYFAIQRIEFGSRQNPEPGPRPIERSPTIAPPPTVQNTPAAFPIDQPNLPIASTIPGTSIGLSGLVFFLGSDTPPSMSERTFGHVFDHIQSSFVYWQLNLAHVALEADESLSIALYLYGPDGNVRSKSTSECKIQKGLANSSCFDKWTDSIDTLPTGDYRVSAFLNGAKIAVETFTLQTPPQPAQAPDSKPTIDASPDARTTGVSSSTPVQNIQPPSEERPAPAPRLEAPMITTYNATHQTLGNSCAGILTLANDYFAFNCFRDRTRSFTVPKNAIRMTNKNGVELLNGKKYHFLIDNSKDDVATVFRNWMQSSN